MEDSTKDLLHVVIALVQLAVVLGGVGWAIYRFRAEAPLRPRVEFDILATFLGPQHDYYATQIIIRAHNKGLRVRRFPSIELLVRGIPRDAQVEEWKGHEPRLYLPDKIVDDAEVVFKENYRNVFVEPGIRQEISFLTRVPSRYRFVSIRAEFRYDDHRTHSAERLFETSTENAA